MEQALKSVQKATQNIDAEIFVVDNDSADKSVELVKEKFSDIILIDNKENLGFSKANNQAIHQAKGEYVLLLNPDTIVEEDTFEKCIEFMDTHPDAGGLGVKMVDGKGEFLPESKRGLPTPWVAFYKISGLSALFPKSKTFGKYHLGYLDKKKTHEIDVLSGAFMFMRKEALDKVGVLDEDYFMYGEDIDLSYRIIQGGYKNYYYPHTRIIHYKGESTKKTSVNYVFIFYGAMKKFAKKHFSPKKAGLFNVLINIAIYSKAVLDIIKNLLRDVRGSLVSGGLIWACMYFITKYWESHYKPENSHFPLQYFTIILPIYVLVWLATNYYSGGNDKPLKFFKIIRGAIIGVLVIAAVSNFIDMYRYSKALIILGGIVSIVVLSLKQIITYYLTHKSLSFGKEKENKIAIIGTKTEYDRVIRLLISLHLNVKSLGYISAEDINDSDKNYLGSLHQIDEIINIHQIDEIIFCSKDIDTQTVISTMMSLSSKFISFKITPDNSDYIIGSDSRNHPGDLYAIEIKLNISKNSNLRNKRTLDILSSILFLLTFPISTWFVKQKTMYLSNSLSVLLGSQSWVGFSEYKDLSLPKLKKGVISPTTELPNNRNNIQIKKQLDFLYAKNYQVIDDIKLIFKFFPLLGGTSK